MDLYRRFNNELIPKQPTDGGKEAWRNGPGGLKAPTSHKANVGREQGPVFVWQCTYQAILNPEVIKTYDTCEFELHIVILDMTCIKSGLI